jgi:hypothetical protein
MRNAVVERTSPMVDAFDACRPCARCWQRFWSSPSHSVGWA